MTADGDVGGTRTGSGPGGEPTVDLPAYLEQPLVDLVKLLKEDGATI